MRLWKRLRLRLRSLLRRRQVDLELDEELRYHLEREAAERGATEALLRFSSGGNFDAVREACRDQRGVAAIENLTQDVYRAARRLGRSLGFTATAVLVLGFGMAAATAMYSLCDGVLLRPMPGVANGRGLVHLEQYNGDELLGDMSYPDYLDYRGASRSYTLALAATSNFDFDVVRPSETQTIGGELVSGSYFRTLGLHAEVGRLLQPSDEHSGTNRVAVISDRLWRAAFGSDPNVVGRGIDISRVATVTVVGVASPDFRGVSQLFAADLWMPITMQPVVAPMGGTANDCLTNRFCGWVTAFGRLRAGITSAQAQGEADDVASRIAAAHRAIGNRRARVVAGLGSWSDDRAHQAGFLELLFAGTLLLAVMTAASLGSLFLARMGRRQPEIATQLALGAGRGRVARQFMFEAGWIAGAGALLGTWSAVPLARGLVRLVPDAPQNFSVALDARVLGFSFGLAAASAFGMALMPAFLTMRRGRLEVALAQSGRGATAVRHRVQRSLLMLQVGTALVLLIAAGLASRTLQEATAGQVPAGADRIALARVDTGHAFYSTAQAAVFFDRLNARLAAQPGVTKVAYTACLEPAPCNRGPVFLPGTEPAEEVIRSHEFSNRYLRPDIDWVSPDFFALFQHRLVQGRALTRADTAGAPLVCVVNQALAKRLWPGSSPVGRRLAWPQFNWTGHHDFTVVGVIADRRSDSLLQAAVPRLYVPMAQVPFYALWLAVHSDLPLGATLKSIRAQVASLDARIPLEQGRTLAEQVRRTLWQPIAIASLAGFCGLLAALLAAIGLFGTVAQSVQERRCELGVRLALGATPIGLVAMVVGDGVRPIAWGLAAGGLAAFGLERLLRPFLYGVAPTDRIAWLASAALLAGVAIAGTWLAAHRAARVPPTDALRCE